MSAATAVRWFKSTMEGAPSIANAFGDTTALLDAVLVNGFNIKTPTTVTRTGSTVNVYYSGGHGYSLKSVLRLSGCTQTDYNGDWVIDYVDSNNLRFDIGSLTPATPATGSPSTKTAPLGWEIYLTATNKRVYRSLNSSSNKPLLRVDNTQPTGWTSGKAVVAKIHMLKTMTDINTPGDQDYAPFRTDLTSFPDWGWWGWRQSVADPGSSVYSSKSNNGSYQHPWAIYGDDRIFYYLHQGAAAGIGADMAMFSFGDFISYKIGDLYDALCLSYENYNMASQSGNGLAYQNNSGAGGPIQGTGRYGTGTYAGWNFGSYLFKSYTGLGPAQLFFKVALDTLNANRQSGQGGFESGIQTGVPFPNGPDFGIPIHPSYIVESGGALRGLMPGLFAIMTNVGTVLNDGQQLTNITGYSGRVFQAQQISNGNANWSNVAQDNSARVMFDITGPWR